MTKGILIYAIGHANYYRMAENLAASLIVNGTKENGISIALICDDESKVRQKDLFNDFIILDADKFIVNDKIVFNNATVLVYDLSPYDVTMKLDADMIWIAGRSVAALFDELNDVDITFSNRGYGWDKGNSVWADEDAIKTAYKLTGEERLYKIYGEFLYFKKAAAIKKYFDTVVKIYNKKKIKTKEFANGNFTDELAFQIACMQTEIYPHQDNFTPIYNGFLGYKNLVRKYPYELKEFYGYSIGGNVTDAFTKNNYNILAKSYFAKLGLSNPYQVVDKRKFLPERTSI
jgi:hypothetical protein